MRQLPIAADTAYARLVQHLETLADNLAESDGALARRILAAAPERDVPAESELCRRFAPRIRLYGLRHLQNHAAAADLVQDVLLMTLQKLRAGEVREPERLASFILGTCRQQVIDIRRTGDRREQLLDTFALDLIAEPEANHVDSARLQHCLQRLPERERTVLIMTFYEDRQAHAVGAELGLTAGNVRVIRHRGIEHLRACMTEQGP
jgi:RNA polymerase sigma-70 factor, ECF subfamily